MIQEDRFYWVKSNTDEPWEVALYTNCAWWFHGAEEDAENIKEMGMRVEQP